MPNNHLLFLGAGYSARALAGSLDDSWNLSGTTRSAETAATLSTNNISPIMWPAPGEAVPADLSTVTEILVSVPPGIYGCVAHGFLQLNASKMPRLRSIGYLSSTGVYGDHGGEWVDESFPPTSKLPRAVRRLSAEQEWQNFEQTSGVPVYILRLSGIYGPGRSAIDNLLDPARDVQRVEKPGHLFNRLHVADIAAGIASLLEKSASDTFPSERIINFADDLPAPPQDVIAHAAALLNLPAPPLIPFARAQLSPMARSFYAENKQVRNDVLKRVLLPELKYPTYREGLHSILQKINHLPAESS